jgi:hypothetical protein
MPDSNGDVARGATNLMGGAGSESKLEVSTTRTSSDSIEQSSADLGDVDRDQTSAALSLRCGPRLTGMQVSAR